MVLAIFRYFGAFCILVNELEYTCVTGHLLQSCNQYLTQIIQVPPGQTAQYQA